METKLKVVDLFAGCGGLSLGLEQAGLEIVKAYDNWQPAINTYRKNLDHSIEPLDLGSGEAIDIISAHLPDIIAGGPPCQDFSSAGKRNEDLGRGDLTTSFAQIVAYVRPQFFIMENVERILKTNKLLEVQRILSAAGYKYCMEVLDASYYNVPQKRKRFFMVGGIDFQPLVFQEILRKTATPKPLTVREFFGPDLDIDYYYRHPRSYARRGVFSVDEPSPTIRGVNRPLPDGYPGHETDPLPVRQIPGLRPLTTKERARIQTFPHGLSLLAPNLRRSR